MSFHVLIYHLFTLCDKMSVPVFCLFSNWTVILQLNFENSYIYTHIYEYTHAISVSFGSIKPLKMLQ